MSSEEVTQSLKEQMRIHVSILKNQGVRPQNIEIELIHYLNSLLYPKPF